MSLLNKAAYKRWCLETVKTLRAQPFSRVSDDMCVWAEEFLKTGTKAALRSLPSKGRTIYPPTKSTPRKPRKL